MGCGNSLGNTTGAAHRQERRQKFYLLLSSLLFEKKKERDEHKKMRLLVLVKARREEEKKPWCSIYEWIHSMVIKERHRWQIPLKKSFQICNNPSFITMKCQNSDVIRCINLIDSQKRIMKIVLHISTANQSFSRWLRRENHIKFFFSPTFFWRVAR